MGLWSRMLLFFNVKTSAALDRAEDPREVLDYAYGQQQELLRKVRQGLLEVATSKRRLEQQCQRLRARVPELENQARRALAAAREDLARIALQRKQASVVELEGLERQLSEVAAEEHRLTVAEQQLSARIEGFRTRRDALSARYTAADAQVRVNEALTGVSDEFAELSMALGRAEEKIERMQARATAIDRLIESGYMSLQWTGGDVVESELRQIAAGKAVEEELAALKAELAQGQPPGSQPGAPAEPPSPNRSEEA